MNKVVKMSDQEKCYDEASAWIVKFDQGLTKAQKKEFKLWLSKSQQNHDVFMSMANLWDGMDELSRLSDLFPKPVIESGKSRMIFVKKRMALAASIVLAVCVFSLISYTSFFPTSLEKMYETSIGEHSTVNLPDGSYLVLNTNSLVRVSYDDVHRLVTLERGEIHIDVAHDETRPLSVKAGDKVIQAVGTAFNIELYEDKKFELIVTDGKVRIGDRNKFEGRLRNLVENEGNDSKLLELVTLPSESFAVSKGEKIVLGAPVGVPLQQATKIDESEIEKNLSWRTGNIIFKGESLEDAIYEIGRYTSVKFVFGDADIRNIRVAGVFRAGDVNGLLTALNDSFDIISVKVDDEQVNLYRGTQ